MPGPTSWMPLYTSDILASCADMSPAQFGAYVRMLCYAWNSGGLPNDMEACCRIAGGISPADWQVCRRRLVVLDPGTSDERLSHPRLEQERERAEKLHKKRCEAMSRARNANRKNSQDQLTDQLIDQSIDQSSDQSIDQLIGTQPQSQPQPQISKNETPTEFLRATRQKPRRTYRIGWSADAGFTGITDDDRRLWGEAYPGVNLVGELAKANVYLRENPAKAGKRNWGAFLARWFGRVQDKGGSPSAPSKAAGWSQTKKYFRAKFQANMTDAEYEAALRGLGVRQKPERGANGISTLSEVISCLNASQGPLNENHPN